MSGSLPAHASAALRERLRALDLLALATVCAGLLSVALAWFLRLLPVDLGPGARAAFVFTLVYALLAARSERLRGARAVAAAGALLQAALILFLAAFWHLAGGLQNPGLLLVFALPVCGAGVLLGRAAAAAEALLALAGVAVVALFESSSLLWYVVQSGLPVASAPRLVAWLPAPEPPFPRLAGEPAFELTLLVGFGVALMACALAAPAVAEAAGRRERRSEAPDATGDPLRAAFQLAPTASVIVRAESAETLMANHSFVTSLLLHGQDVRGRELFELVAFDEPRAVRALLAAGQGEIAFCAYRVGPERRVARLRVSHAAPGCACVSLEEATTLHHVTAALDADSQPLLVIGADERLCYSNRAAQELFGELFLGLEAALALDGPGRPPGWWQADGGTVEGRQVESRRLNASDASPGVTLLRLKAPDGPR